MEYLFFDIECADGFHICSFGYVIVDESFTVLEKRDILMNPECAFRLSRARFDPYVQLAYGEKEFRKHPSFGKQYAALRALLTQPNRILLGHSIASDLNFLETAYEKYDKPHLLLNVYDTQSFYCRYAPQYQARSLENIVQDLGIDVSGLTEHKSCDDAEMSMLVAKELCRRSECGMPDFLARHGDCVVCSSDIVVAKALKALKQQYPQDRYAPSVCLSDALRFQNAEKRINLLRVLLQKKYNITNSVGKCRYFVSNDGDGERDKTYAAKVAEGKKIRKISTDKLSEMLGIDVNASGETGAVLYDGYAVSLQNAFTAARRTADKSKSV